LEVTVLAEMENKIPVLQEWMESKADSINKEKKQTPSLVQQSYSP